MTFGFVFVLEYLLQGHEFFSGVGHVMQGFREMLILNILTVDV